MAAERLDILVVDDEPELREQLRRMFRRHGHHVVAVPDARSALDQATTGGFDVVLLDVALGPGPDGYDVCRTLRARRNVVPVIMLTALDTEADAVLGLEAGADDYVTKPFEPSILAARLRAVLRRVARHDASPVLRIRELVIDRDGMEVQVAGEPVSLTPTEYRLLIELAEHSGVVCSRERLLEDVWGYIWAGDTRLVDMHVRRLRAKIGADMSATVRGAGYKLVKG